MSARAGAPAGGVPDADAASLQWWSSRRKRFTRVLVCSGVAAMVADLFALSLCDPWMLGPEVEFSILTLVGQSLILAVFVALANVVYTLAGRAEALLCPRNPARFRPMLYLAVLAAAAAVPWYLPVSDAVWCVTAPRTPPPEALAAPAANRPFS